MQFDLSRYISSHSSMPREEIYAEIMMLVFFQILFISVSTKTCAGKLILTDSLCSFSGCGQDHLSSDLLDNRDCDTNSTAAHTKVPGFL